MFPSPAAPVGAMPRQVPEGTIPLISVEGSAYDCGREYGEIVAARYTAKLQDVGGDHYDPTNRWWAKLPREQATLLDRLAPHLVDVFRGVEDGIAGRAFRGGPLEGECTSFGVNGSATLDGLPIAGQNKDVGANGATRYITLRMRIKDAPTILVLCYPGEVLGYGMWSNGMCMFRTSMHSPEGEKGMRKELFGFLAFACASTAEAIELARKHGVRGSGNRLLIDSSGETATVEFNKAGVGVVPARDGITTHANHPEAEGPRDADRDWSKHGYGASERAQSDWRMHGLWQLLNAERGRLTAQKALSCLADHTYYPQSICRHWVEGRSGMITNASVVAEPGKGLLHVVRGQPCSNWPVTYSL